MDERVYNFIKMLKDSIDGGGRVVTFQDDDIQELEDILVNSEVYEICPECHIDKHLLSDNTYCCLTEICSEYRR